MVFVDSQKFSPNLEFKISQSSIEIKASLREFKFRIRTNFVRHKTKINFTQIRIGVRILMKINFPVILK